MRMMKRCTFSTMRMTKLYSNFFTFLDSTNFG